METATQQVRPAITAWKEPRVNEIAEAIKSSKTIAIVDLVNLPSRQLQEIRAKIKGQISIHVTRKRLLKRALEKAGVKGIEKLVENLKGMSAIICTDMDSFELFRVLKSNMSNSTAKPGQIAPFDIEVKAGITPFSPGPILSELGDVGLKSAIEGGKVAIKEDAIIVKEGEAISENVASILSRLDIKPIKVGLNLVAALEEGKILTASVLNVDVDEYLNNIKKAHSDAFRLAMAQGILTKETSEALIQKAERESIALAISQNILTSKTVGGTIAKAEQQALALKNKTE